MTQGSDDKLRERARRLARAVRQNGKGHQLRTDEEIAEDFLDATRTEALAEGREQVVRERPRPTWPSDSIRSALDHIIGPGEGHGCCVQSRHILLDVLEELEAWRTPATPQQEDEHGD